MPVWTCDAHRSVFAQQASAALLLALMERQRELDAVTPCEDQIRRILASPDHRPDDKTLEELGRYIAALDRFAEALAAIGAQAEDHRSPDAGEAAAFASAGHEAMQVGIRALLGRWASTLPDDSL